MYLKSIEIQGFKSFANKMEFRFQDGITGIVGPNGSGKSNVADAVRWVLGEQSAKELRGSSMQDVIFSGTETRKPMGYAYVSITLDNSDHALNVDFDEVTVARRVYRSGESEYLMNGSVCRLRDIDELFYDTGIGQEGYSIIGQGQIDKILSGKADDRRELFDEAAGIVKFKRRKAAAIKKLTDQKANQLRVNDLISELEKQQAPLKHQSDTARAYLEKRDRLKDLDINIFLQEMDRLDQDLLELEENTGTALNDLKELSERYEESRRNYEETGGSITLLEQEIEKKRTEISDSTVFQGQIQGRVNVLKEKINTLRVSDEHFTSRLAELKKDLSQYQESLSQASARKAAVDEKVEAGASGLNETRESLAALESEVQTLHESIEENKGALIDLLNARSNIRANLGRHDTMLEQADVRMSELSARLLRSRSDEEELQEEIDEALADLDSVSAEIGKEEEEAASLEQEAGTIAETLEKNDRNHHSLEIQYHEKKSRLEGLKNMAERYEGYGNAVRRVMEQKSRERGLLGVTADLIRVDEAYEAAIETALGGSLQNVVTRDEETAKRMIRMLKETKSGRATFLPLNAIQPRNLSVPESLREPGVIGAADSLVKCEKQYQALAKHLLGNFLVVDNVENALNIARKYHYRTRIVTLEGEALNPGGSLSGGAFMNRNGLLGRNREIEAKQKEMKEILRSVDACLEAIEDLRDRKRENDRAREALREKRQETELKRNTCALRLKTLQDRKVELTDGSGGIFREKDRIEAQILEIRESREAVCRELADSEAEEKIFVSKNDELNLSLDRKSAEAARVRSELSEADRKNASLLEKQRFEAQEVERLSTAIRRAEAEIASNERSIGEDAREIEEKEAEIRSLEEEIRNSGSASSSSQTELDRLIEKKEELRKKRDDIFTDREALAEHKSSAEREIDRLVREKEKREANEESLTGYMWDEYQLTRSAAAELEKQDMGDLPGMKREASVLKGEIRSLGSVNVNAIEEYKALMERYTFMDEQRNDLLKAEKDLTDIIEELERNMKSLFSEKFAEISSQYDVVFRQLFGGGKGTLVLVDPENLLESDIRIIAQPPGKKLQNMMQLSGGEKALSAIALLFAIQALKPSPFCLLDEIEAALDEANVDRFASYLSRLTEHTQFIVITHRRGTMMKADRLYGVTMQEKGVSTQVNVDLTSSEFS